MPILDPNLSWLIKNKELLRIYQIEKELKMPQGTLRKFVDGERGLTEQWQRKVIKRVEKLRK